MIETTWRNRLVRVTVERTGGFAGLQILWSVNSAELSRGKARELADLIGALDLSQVQPNRVDAPREAFQYVVTVESRGQKRVFLVNEREAPEPLGRLLLWVLATTRTHTARSVEA